MTHLLRLAKPGTCRWSKAGASQLITRHIWCQATQIEDYDTLWTSCLHFSEPQLVGAVSPHCHIFGTHFLDIVILLYYSINQIVCWCLPRINMNKLLDLRIPSRNALALKQPARQATRNMSFTREDSHQVHINRHQNPITGSAPQLHPALSKPA